MDLVLVGLGGGLGSVLRWGIGLVVGERCHGDFPLGTFLINVSGSLLIGYLSVLFGVDWRNRYGHGLVLNALVITGVLGGSTDLSSMQLDTAKLAEKKHGLLAPLISCCRSHSVCLPLCSAPGSPARRAKGVNGRDQNRYSRVRRRRVGRDAARVSHAGGATGIARLPASISSWQSRGGVTARTRSGTAQQESRLWGTYALIGTGISGGLSTFSSFAYASPC